MPLKALAGYDGVPTWPVNVEMAQLTAAWPPSVLRPTGMWEKYLMRWDCLWRRCSYLWSTVQIDFGRRWTFYLWERWFGSLLLPLVWLSWAWKLMAWSPGITLRSKETLRCRWSSCQIGDLSSFTEAILFLVDLKSGCFFLTWFGKCVVWKETFWDGEECLLEAFIIKVSWSGGFEKGKAPDALDLNILKLRSPYGRERPKQ